MASTDRYGDRVAAEGAARGVAGRATFAVLSLTHNYKVIIAREAPRAEMQASVGVGDRGHDLDAIPEPRSAVSEVELCISSFDYCKVGDVRIVMMIFQ